MSDDKRILIVSHGHPEHSKGGGEMAAYNLHLALDERAGHEPVFFARHDRDELLHGGTPFAGNGREREILFHSTMPDWFRFSQPDKARVWRDFREALEITRPDVVHFHHYVHLGLELIREVRRFDASIPIVMTLHEYFGICHNHGQMVKTGDNALCHAASPAACHGCFPTYAPQDFMLRERFIKGHFDLVDRFVSPSRFLKARYVAWGLPAERIEVIENLLSPEARRQAREAAAGDATSPRAAPGSTTTSPGRSPTRSPDQAIAPSADEPLRFAFFGQINGFKGVDVLLDAFAALPDDVRRRVRLDINGSGLERQPETLRDALEERMEELDDVVRLRGPYRTEELGSLMGAADWMIVPSVWWENSPVVILEARRYGLPVICSDIGGMAEKIEHERTGLHFLARRADALAECIVRAVRHPEERERFARAIAASWTPDADLERHVALYSSLDGTRGREPATLRVV